jgi:hypothetical protein
MKQWEISGEQAPVFIQQKTTTTLQNTKQQHLLWTTDCESGKGRKA